MTTSEHFSVEQSDGVTIIRVVDTKSFDTDNYAVLQQQMVDFVEEQQPTGLLVDLSNVQYCATALINTMLMAQKRMDARGAPMKLFGLSEVVLETLERLNLVGSFFAVLATEADARETL